MKAAIVRDAGDQHHVAAAAALRAGLVQAIARHELLERDQVGQVHAIKFGTVARVPRITLQDRVGAREAVTIRVCTAL